MFCFNHWRTNQIRENDLNWNRVKFSRVRKSYFELLSKSHIAVELLWYLIRKNLSNPTNTMCANYYFSFIDKILTVCFINVVHLSTSCGPPLHSLKLLRLILTLEQKLWKWATYLIIEEREHTITFHGNN